MMKRLLSLYVLLFASFGLIRCANSSGDPETIAVEDSTTTQRAAINEPPGKRIMLPMKAGGVYSLLTGSRLNVQPGDTLVIPAGTSTVFLKDFQGSPERYVHIVHEKPGTMWGKPGAYIFSIESARYFSVSGMNINGGPTHKGFNLACGKLTSDYTLEDIQTNYGVNGIKASWNPDPANPATYGPNSINNVIIRRVKVRNTETEGLYLGNTQPVTSTTLIKPARIVNLTLEDIETDSTKWDGSQIASADNVKIRNVRATNFGTAKVSGQQAGLLVGGYVTISGTIENIYTANGSGAGLTIFGRGRIHVKNFELKNANGGIYADDYADGTFGLPVQELIFENGTISGSVGKDIEIRNAKKTAKPTVYINVKADPLKFLDNTGGKLTPITPPPPIVTKEVFKRLSAREDGRTVYYTLYKDSSWTIK